MFYEVIPGRNFGKGGGVLTYRYDGSLVTKDGAGDKDDSLVTDKDGANKGDSLSSGTIVEVPLGRKQVPGVVLKKVAQPDFPTKPISRILYSTPLPRHLLVTARFIAEYYQVSLGAAMGLILPAGITKKPRRKKSPDIAEIAQKTEIETEKLAKVGTDGEVKTTKADENGQKTEQKADRARILAKKAKIPLNPAQKQALRALQETPGATKLLLGLTGSGKTNIYLTEALRALERGKSVIVLVPEIALTSQLVRVFEETLGEQVVVMHSNLKETERRRIFVELLEETGAKVVIGPRSALFAPLHNLGLIIIDEEHETAYWQENAPKYSAVRVASFMAQELRISCILGSATPNVVDYHLARQRGTVVWLDKKAKTGAVRPEVQLIDLKKRENFDKNRYFSDALLAAIKRNLEQGWQTLIFHNRRGSAPLTICEQCGEEIVCPNCFLPLTLHADCYEMVCHTCDFRMAVPASCPKCGAAGLVHKGFGTKLLETELKKLFPSAKIRRFDADNRRGESLATNYEAVRDGEVEILVGTQTVAKGLDLPRLATVGVVQADAGLSLPDYAAEERTFQLLTQVMGRVGRGHLEQAEVFVQTFRPEHPIFQYALSEDYAGFADYALKRRREAGFPPYRFVAQAAVTLKTERLVVQKVRALATQLSGVEGLLVSPPMPAFHEHTAKGYTWQVVVRGRSRKQLIELLSGLDANFRVSFDPPSLL